MSQSGYTPVQLYRSTTAAAAPSAGNLAAGELAINTTDEKLYFKNTAGTVKVLATTGAGAAGGSTTQVQYNSSGVLAGSSSFVFDGTNVGIGTASPSTKLHVDGSGKGTLFGSSSALNFYSAWQYNGTDIGYIGNGAAVLSGSGATDFGIDAPGARNLCLGTNDVERMRITSGGNVGIGTGSTVNAKVDAKLAADGSGYRLSGSYDGSAIIDAGQVGSDGYFKVNSATGSTVSSFSGYAGTPSYVLSRLGVGTASPATTFDVSGATAGNVVAVSASAVDCATGNYFTKTASGALTWTFTNVPASRSYAFALQLTNGGSGTQTWPAAVVWNGGTAPTLQTSGTDILVFVTSDSGTTWRGVRAWKQA